MKKSERLLPVILILFQKGISRVGLVNVPKLFTKVRNHIKYVPKLFTTTLDGVKSDTKKYGLNTL